MKWLSLNQLIRTLQYVFIIFSLVYMVIWLKFDFVKLPDSIRKKRFGTSWWLALLILVQVSLVKYFYIRVIVTQNLIGIIVLPLFTLLGMVTFFKSESIITQLDMVVLTVHICVGLTLVLLLAYRRIATPE